MFKVTAGLEYEGKLEALFQINKILWRLALLQAFIIVALVVGYLKLKETVNVTVELPSKIYNQNDRTIRKGMNWASKNYYEVWADSLIDETASFTVENISEKYALLQKMMRPSIAIKKDKEIQDYVKTVIQNRIKQTFTILKHDTTALGESEHRIIFNGVVDQKVGNKDLPKKECSYTVDLKIYEDGVLYVENFGTDCL